MAIITDREAPPDVPTTNDLPKHANDFKVPGSATIRFANKDLLVMDEPPLPGQHVKIELTLKRKGGAFDDIGDDGETSWACRTVLVGAKVTAEPYTPVVAEAVKTDADDDQPSLYGDRDDDDDSDADEDGDSDAD